MILLSLLMSAFHPKADIQYVRARGLMSAYGGGLNRSMQHFNQDS